MSEYISNEITKLKDAEKYLCSYITLCDELLKSPNVNIKTQKKVITTFNKLNCQNAMEDLLYKQNNIKAIILIKNIVEKKLCAIKKEIEILEKAQSAVDKIKLSNIIQNTEIA